MCCGKVLAYLRELRFFKAFVILACMAILPICSSKEATELHDARRNKGRSQKGQVRISQLNISTT